MKSLCTLLRIVISTTAVFAICASAQSNPHVVLDTIFAENWQKPINC